MRSTKAAYAVERLNTRAEGAQHYSMTVTSNGYFYLVLKKPDGVAEKIGEPLELDAFVKFVNGYGPQKPKRVSKLDVAFEKQLQKDKPD